MAFRLATWNINSVRLRIGLVERLLASHAPDVLCLQEIKCLDDQFPRKALRKAGYEHVAVRGQKAYHGVAIVSRLPLLRVAHTDWCAMGDARHVEAVVETGCGPVRVHNFYVPAGGDEPDRATNPKFDHKLTFVDEMRALRAGADGIPCVLVGDLNIAPLESDVWSHRQLLKVVSHTPVEVEAFARAFQEGGWTDVMRRHVAPADRLFTWWSYRARDWEASDRGRRLDHVWAEPSLAARSSAMEVLREARSWEKPSDHVPVIVDFDL